MTYEFEYFFEPNDENKPIVRLLVECDLDISSEPHPANPARTAYTCELSGLSIRSAQSGMDVTSMFSALKPRLMAVFQRDHLQDALDKYAAYEGAP